MLVVVAVAWWRWVEVVAKSDCAEHALVTERQSTCDGVIMHSDGKAHDRAPEQTFVVPMLRIALTGQDR